jgi:hypothetical protein
VVAAAAALGSTAVVRGLVASWLWVWSVGVVAAVLLALAHGGGAQPLGGIDVAFTDGTLAAGLYRVFAEVGWLVAVAAPAAAAGYVAYRSVRRGSGIAAATLGGAAGTVLLVAVYRARGDAIVAGDAGWTTLALVELALSLGVAVLTAVVTRVRQRGPAAEAVWSGRS